MAKEYERKSITAEMIMVDFDTQIEKRGGGSYEGTNILFKAFGKVNEKGLHSKTFEFKPELRAQLEAVQKKGTLFTLNQYREVGGQFWNVDSVDAGHTIEQPAFNDNTSGRKNIPAGGTPQQAQGYSQGPNPAAVGQAINLAADVLGFKAKDFSDVNKVREAIIWYKATKDIFSDNWEAADKEPQPKVDESPQEDDVPF